MPVQRVGASLAGYPTVVSSDRLTTTLLRAGAVGAVCGMRTFTGPAILAIGGGWGDGAPARLLPAAGVGELVADKLPQMPARSEPPLFAARVLSGAICGAGVAALAGRAALRCAAAGGLAAALAVVPTERLRAALGRWTGVPDPLLGVAEDVLAVTVLLAATDRLNGG